MEKDKILAKCLLDNNDAMNLEDMSKELDVPKAKLLREGIKSMSSKEFDLMLPEYRLDYLQKISDESWEVLNRKGHWFEKEETKNEMPIFITEVTTEKSMLHLKYPTFRVQFFTHVNYEKVKDLFAEKNLSPVVQEPSQIMLNNINIYSVTCLALELSENERIRENVIDVLKKEKYEYSIYPTCCLRSVNIIYSDDKKLFKVDK